MNSKITLLDLPILPRDRDRAGRTSIILDTYIKERNEISSVSLLKAHIKRWENLFRLTNENFPNLDLTNIFNIKEEDYETILAHIKKLLLKQDKGLDFEDELVGITMDIFIPPTLLQATIIAKKYEVGHDLIMVRLYLDPYPEFIHYLR